MSFLLSVIISLPVDIIEKNHSATITITTRNKIKDFEIK